MDPALRQKIIDKLTTYLNRPPTETEIVNGQTDERLMGWIRDDEIAALNESLTAVNNNIANLKDGGII